MSKGANYGPDNASDFELPEELLGILPTDPYEQLELARRITSIAVGSRVSKLEAEASKFKIKITEKDQRIYELEEKINQLEKALNETDERLSHSLEEQAKLNHDKSVLAATVKKLNRDVAKLETFKKTLMQSLQEEDEAAQADVTQNTATRRVTSAKLSFSLSSRDDSNVPIGETNQVSSAVSETSNSTLDGDNQASRHGKSKGIPLTPHNNTPPELTPKLTPNGSPKRLSPPQSPRRHSASMSPTRHQFEGRLSSYSSLPASHQATAPTSPPHSRAQAHVRIDGKEFFRQARNRLSFEQFSAFLANIKELNSHRQTREETLHKADEIFGSDNKDLYVIFDSLLHRHLS
uniref:At4g15545-like C-terminal domain-containing protein n=1 Tax=Picea sitchensis TaxID=3332 RepID=A9NUU7_PICSI|nr:unknown [Picea sitchensis]